MSPSSPIPAPSVAAEESYHTQHAPFGAFASFTVGLVGGQGGFGQSLGGPARQNVYIGFRRDAAARWELLPFFEPPKSAEAVAAFTGEAATAQPPKNFRALGPADYARTLGWASDTWRASDGRFGFSLLTPFGKVADPARMSRAAARLALAPVVTGWIEFDNRDGASPAEMIFGVGDQSRPMRPLEDVKPDLLGFAGGTAFGYATPRVAGVEQRQGFDVFAPTFRDFRGLHVIGGESALIFTVPAGKKKRFPLALGFFQGGVVTTGLRASFAYARVFADLEDVLTHGLKNRAYYARVAATRDRELARARLDDDQKFLIAQGTHSYFGNTELLWRDGASGRGSSEGPLWVVNEGEYRMMNTFDLTVDHVFFELEWFPWAVRNALDLFASRYAYTDRLKLNGRGTAPGGISFTHDMGVMNHFTPPGRSSYECDELHGCFSHMTMEQLLNWVITAVIYADKTGDRAWLRRNRATLLACAASLRERDDPDPRKRDGILKYDTARCGDGGSEITTYDSLDVSLGQARNNLYLAVKTLAAWVLLERAFGSLGVNAARDDARVAGDRLATTLTAKFSKERGFFPAVFENGNLSRIIPAVEGFVYPLYLGIDEATDPQGRFGRLIELLRRHLVAVMQPGVCIDEKSGAWKMSSTSTNTWFSKIALAQHVVRKMFPEAMNAAARAADRVHAQWQRRPGCGAFAMCDQINSETGVTCGSRYYPRGVTTILWLQE